MQTSDEDGAAAGLRRRELVTRGVGLAAAGLAGGAFTAPPAWAGAPSPSRRRARVLVGDVVRYALESEAWAGSFSSSCVCSPPSSTARQCTTSGPTPLIAPTPARSDSCGRQSSRRSSHRPPAACSTRCRAGRRIRRRSCPQSPGGRTTRRRGASIVSAGLASHGCWAPRTTCRPPRQPARSRSRRLRATVDRYSFDVENSHLLPHAGLSRRLSDANQRWGVVVDVLPS